MEFSNYIPLIVAIVIFFVLYNFMSRQEGFAQSGLALPSPTCQQLADVYYKPGDHDPTRRADYRERICGRVRRDMVDFPTGNYFTEDGELV